MVGIPGSGKSFFAEKFAETFGAPYVGWEPIATLGVEKATAERIAWLQMQQLAKTGTSLVLELDTKTRASRTDLSKELKAAGYTPLYVWVQTDTDTARYRSAKKKGCPVDFEAESARFSPPHALEKPIVISGKHTYASQARAVLKRLSAPRAAAPTLPKPPVRPGASNITVR